jgi:hypothetical protein
MQQEPQTGGTLRRISLMTLIVVCYLASPRLAKADALYTFVVPNEWSLSFDAPGLITTTTTVTSFLSTNVVLPLCGAENQIPTISGVSIMPTFPGLLDTGFVCPFGGAGGPIADFSSPLTAFGAYSTEVIGFPATLTISAVPEPSSLLLLGTGLLGVLALAARSKRHAPPTQC